MSLLATVVLHNGVFPWQVLGPYINMMRGAQVVNMLLQGAGKPYRRRCSIPQGCPFSMMTITLLLRPWSLANPGCNVIPRTLAHDLLLVVLVAQAVTITVETAMPNLDVRSRLMPLI